jgi:ribonuclease P protein component
MDQHFLKQEHLKSSKAISALFEKANSYAVYPVRIIWQFAPDTYKTPALLQVAFAVPKKNFKRANRRNLIRRRMREAWRLHKPVLTLQADKTVQAMLLYTAKEELTYQEIEAAMNQVMGRLAKHVEKVLETT